MFRRTASLLVIAGLLANQLAAIPHAHAAGEPAGHDASPHFHWVWFGWGEAHSDHEHEHCSHAGDHASTPSSSTCESVESSCSHSLCNCFDRESHDQDSVYVPELNCIRSDAAGKAPQVDAPQVTGLVHTAALGHHPQALSPLSRHWRPPDEVLAGSNSYLTLRNLRI